MERTMERRGLRQRGAVRLGAVLLAGGLIAAGCSSSDSAESSPSTIQAPSLTPETTESVTLVFDDLDGGSPIIRVYPGVGTTDTDKQYNGTFNDGDSVTAECKTEGRTVQSDPSVGEEDRTSSEWVRVQGTPGETQFATAVYIENPEDLLGQLENC